MSLHHIAKALEKKGRNGDTMLMHVQPGELSVLEAMLGKTTRNPHTGLPEAGVWSKILKGLAIGGAALLGPAALIPTLGAVIGINKAGSKNNSAASEAGKYQDARTAQRVKDQYVFAPPTTFLQSIADQVKGSASSPMIDPMGQQKNWYAPNASAPDSVPKMGSGIGGFAQGGQMTEEQAKETVMALLAQMHQQQPQQQPMAQGRRVDGPGTGLDDSIPARLSVGEYVIPADVVSMMGDGSTEAGGRKLDQLLAHVRMQKTGSKKQAKPLQMGRM